MKKLLVILAALLLLTGCAYTADLSDVESLTPVTRELPEVPEQITAELIEATKNSACVRYTNVSDKDWEYGQSYSVHVLLDGTWYAVPHRSDTDVFYVFTSEAYVVQPGDYVYETCEFRNWNTGCLPPGHYRLVTNYFAAEFDIE